jgi:hypothetical protein
MKRRNIYTFVILFSLILFEFISYATSKKSLYDLMGVASWASLLAFALSAIDFAGVARLVTGDTLEESNGMLVGAWILSAMGDGFLTFVAIHTTMLPKVNHVMVTSGVISPNMFIYGIPAFMAVLFWVIQMTLVIGMNKILDNLILSNRPRRQEPLPDRKPDQKRRVRV